MANQTLQQACFLGHATRWRVALSCPTEPGRPVHPPPPVRHKGSDRTATIGLPQGLPVDPARIARAEPRPTAPTGPLNGLACTDLPRILDDRRVRRQAVPGSRRPHHRGRARGPSEPSGGRPGAALRQALRGAPQGDLPEPTPRRVRRSPHRRGSTRPRPGVGARTGRRRPPCSAGRPADRRVARPRADLGPRPGGRASPASPPRQLPSPVRRDPRDRRPHRPRGPQRSGQVHPPRRPVPGQPAHHPQAPRGLLQAAHPRPHPPARADQRRAHHPRGRRRLRLPLLQRGAGLGGPAPVQRHGGGRHGEPPVPPPDPAGSLLRERGATAPGRQAARPADLLL